MKSRSLFVYLIFFMIIGCATENTSKGAINDKKFSVKNYELILKKPYKDLNVSPEIVLVDSQKDSLYKLSKGGHIYVPANSFLHLSGEPVTGSIEISIEIYKTLGDIILSGIPMKYDSAGVEYDFTSAGMYSISGKQDNESVVIAPQKTLEVGITSNVEDSPCFNFYELKESGDWNYLSTQEATLNPDFPVDIEIPEKPEIINEDDLVFDLNIQKMSKYDNSELQFYLWQYDGLRMDTLNKELLSNINYKNLKLEKTSKSQWSYNLQLSDKNKIINIPVKPAFTEDNFEAAMKEYENALKTFQANQSAALAISQGKYLRISSILNFGIYNYDKVINDQNRNIIVATFDVGKDYSNDFISVYLISQNENAVIRYESYSFDKFSYNALHNNLLVATLPNNEVAVMNASTFKNYTSTNEGGNIHFKLKLLDKLVTSSEGLDALIKSL